MITDTNSTRQTSKTSTGNSLSRAELVAQLKARNGSLPDDFQHDFMPIRIELPVTCAMIPRDVCIAAKIFSCHPCDQYRLVMAEDGTYRGKSQQQYSRRYQCQCPNKSVLLQWPTNVFPWDASDMGEESPSDSQGSSISSLSQTTTTTTTTRPSRRKRKPCIYEIPDSDCSEGEQDPHFERLVNAVVTNGKKRRAVNSVDSCSQSTQSPPQGSIADDTPIQQYLSQGTQTIADNSPIQQYLSKETQTDNTNPQPMPLRNTTINNRPAKVMVSMESQTDITFSVGRWSTQSGKDLEQTLIKAITEEELKDLRKLTKKERRINLELFGKTMLSAINFAFMKRRIKTRANTIVFSTFRYLCKWKPNLFKEAILVESRQFLRTHVFQPWKFQKSIDINAAGGLNYESCNSIRNDVMQWRQLLSRLLEALFT
jgi:hypothetical protein